MSSVALPGIGIDARWEEGENGWKPGMDENLARLSSLVQTSVPSITSSLSTSGGVQIAPSSHANAGQICFYAESQWWFYQPFAGMSVWVRDVSSRYIFDGTVWRREASSAHVISDVVSSSRTITETEFSTGATIEVNSSDDVIITIPGPSSSPSQLGSALSRRPVHIIRTGTGGVTINANAGSNMISADDSFSAREQFSAMVIIPLPSNRYLIAGDTQ